MKNSRKVAIRSVNGELGRVSYVLFLIGLDNITKFISFDLELNDTYLVHSQQLGVLLSSLYDGIN